MVNGNPDSVSWRHLICLLTGGVAIAFAPIFVVLSGQIGGVGMLDAAFWRVFMGAIAMAVIVLPQRGMLFPAQRTDRRRIWLWLPGILFAFDFAVWHWSFEHTSVANSTLLANVSIIFMTLFGWLVWKEKISRTFLLGALVAGAGVVLLLYSSASRDDQVVPGGNALFGDFLGLCTAVFYASYLLCTKRLRREHPAPRLMFWASVVSSLILLPFALCHPDPFLPSSAVGWLPLIGVGVISHAIGQGLIAYGLSGLPASLASVSLLIQPLCVVILELAILGRIIVAWQYIGAACVLVGLTVVIRGRAASPVTKMSRNDSGQNPV